MLEKLRLPSAIETGTCARRWGAARRSLATWLLTIAVLGAATLPLAAQEEVRLQLVDVDTAQFPIVRITLLTADDRSAPITDLSQLTLREDGAPVTEVTYDNVPVGIDVTFVLDANVGYNEVDDGSGLSRREKVEESIRRFAELYMSRDGLDRVSIVVPAEDGENSLFLLEDATTPEEVVTAIEGYEPSTLRPTPLNAMFVRALEQMQQREENGRFRALLLFSDSRRLPDQLSYTLLTAQASDSNTPIYAAILGAEADPQEIDNVRRLYQPTRGTYVHLQTDADADPIYQIWQQQGNPLQLSYRSRQRQSGRNQISINLGSTTVGTSFDVDLQAPQVELEPAGLEIRRVGRAANTPLADLQPAVQPLAIRVVWPDGQPRLLSDVAVTVDGRPQPLLNGALPEEPADSLDLQWDISGLDEGEVELVVTVTDELGYQGSSNAIPVVVTTERPLPAVIEPSPAPTELVSETSVPFPTDLALPFGREIAAATVVLLLALIGVRRWRRRKLAAGSVEPQELAPLPAEKDTSAGKQDVEEELVATLVPLGEEAGETIELRENHITIGRATGLAGTVVSHPSLAQLHARIRQQNDGYWLFDEGSAEGTYLNYERLGLAPRLLQDGDIVQFGSVRYRFLRRPAVDADDFADDPAMKKELAVIFDMDGLMVDTEPLSRLAWDRVLADLGCEPMDDDFYNMLIGKRLQETAETLVAHYALDIEPEDLAWQKEVAFARIRRVGVPIMPGLQALIAALKERDIRWGVATSTPRRIAEEILAQIGVAESCQALAAGDEVLNGKPDPAVYLLAAQRLNITPEQCLALEDSGPGCRAAHAAGMMAIAIPDWQTATGKYECADYVMSSLMDVVDRLDDLLAELRQR